MKIRDFSAFFLLFLLSIACVAGARKDPRDYWKSKMNGDPMPKALTDLLQQAPAASDDTNSDRFVRNFETKPNVIIYHSHPVQSEKSNP